MVRNKSKTKKTADNPIKSSVLRLQYNFDMNDELHSKRLFYFACLLFFILFVGIGFSIFTSNIVPLFICAFPIMLASIMALIYTVLLFVFSISDK